MRIGSVYATLFVQRPTPRHRSGCRPRGACTDRGCGCGGAGDCSTVHRGLDEMLSIGTLPRHLVVVCVNTDRYLVDETMTIERVRTAYLILALGFVHNIVHYQDLVWCLGPSQWQLKFDLPGTAVPAFARVSYSGFRGGPEGRVEPISRQKLRKHPNHNRISRFLRVMQ